MIDDKHATGVNYIICILDMNEEGLWASQIFKFIKFFGWHMSETSLRNAIRHAKDAGLIKPRLVKTQCECCSSSLTRYAITMEGRKHAHKVAPLLIAHSLKR